MNFHVADSVYSSSGVGLRTLYLPGLEGLKEELRMMDWLMERLMPQLKQHLDVSPGYCLLCMLLALWLLHTWFQSCGCLHICWSESAIRLRADRSVAAL